MSKVVVVAVHPDDESIGCGGTLLKLKSLGHEIHWVIVTCADTFPGITSEDLKNRKSVIQNVSELYNFDSVHELNLPTTMLDTISHGEIISKLSKIFSDIQPDEVYLPFAYDVHSDHRVAFECAYSCTKSFRYPSIKKIYMIETLSETEFAPAITSTSFVPNTFVDITDFFDKKIEILKQYETELGAHPFPRSLDTIKALSMVRGAACNATYAESFVLLKEIK